MKRLHLTCRHADSQHWRMLLYIPLRCETCGWMWPEISLQRSSCCSRPSLWQDFVDSISPAQWSPFQMCFGCRLRQQSTFLGAAVAQMQSGRSWDMKIINLIPAPCRLVRWCVLAPRAAARSVIGSFTCELITATDARVIDKLSSVSPF